MSSNNIILKKCIIPNCNRLLDETFYDKSVYRPICSKEHYSKYIDNLPKRYEKKRFTPKLNQLKEIESEYYMRGHLVLVNFKL
jgi:hypothetical protein